MLSNYVLITGGSDGIGLELAKLFAKDKHNLVLAARNIEKLNKAKEMLKGEGIDVRIISVDLSSIKALSKLTKHFLPMIIKAKQGGILNVASTAAFCSGPKMAAYYGSKAYVLNLTEAIHEEVKKDGIKVSCLCPGPVKTSFQAKAGIEKSEGAKKYLMEAKDVAKEGYKGFKKGKAIIVPGIKNKFLVNINKFVPRSIVRKIVLKTNEK